MSDDLNTGRRKRDYPISGNDRVNMKEFENTGRMAEDVTVQNTFSLSRSLTSYKPDNTSER